MKAVRAMLQDVDTFPQVSEETRRRMKKIIIMHAVQWGVITQEDAKQLKV
jgi:hypothetical protein